MLDISFIRKVIYKIYQASGYLIRTKFIITLDRDKQTLDGKNEPIRGLLHIVAFKRLVYLKA